MMNNEELIDVKTLRPFRRFIYTIGALPSSYLMSMTYEEQLVWLCNYLEKTVIPTINNNGLAVEELQNKYNELKSYVDNYFDDLDVQEEINNKLDKMAESGELTDIIAQYLGLAGVLVYNNVSELKLAENLVNGSICKTLGYNSIGDNGGSFYKVRTIINTDNPNDQDIIALHDPSLIAELVEGNYITPEMFGCIGDGEEDDTDNLQDAINYSIANKILLRSRKDKKYIVSDKIVIDGVFEGDFENAEINGDFNDVLLEIKVSDNQGYDEDKEIYYSYGGYLKNLILNGNSTCTKGINFISQKKFTCENIEIIDCGIGLDCHSITECVFDTIRFQKCNIGLNNEGSDGVFNNIFGRFCNVGINTTTYLEINKSHFWVRDTEDEWTNSIYAKTSGGIKLENAQIDNYETGIKLLGTGSYPVLVSGLWQQAENDKQYTLFDVTSGSYDATGSGIRLYNFTATGKTTSPLSKLSNVNSDVFGGFIDYKTSRFVRIDKFPLTTHTKLTNIASEISVVENRVDIDGYKMHVLLTAKVTTAFKDKVVAKLPSTLQLNGIPLYGKAFLGVTSAQYSISNSQQILGGYVSRNQNISIYTLDNNNMPIDTYFTIEFDIVSESKSNINTE